jgi:hypothetical protein
VLPEILGLSESELGMEHGSADEINDAGDVDAMFAAMMIPHHEGAIAMAGSRRSARSTRRSSSPRRSLKLRSARSEFSRSMPPSYTTDEQPTVGRSGIRVHSPISGMARFGHRTWPL